MFQFQFHISYFILFQFQFRVISVSVSVYSQSSISDNSQLEVNLMAGGRYEYSFIFRFDTSYKNICSDQPEFRVRGRTVNECVQIDGTCDCCRASDHVPSILVSDQRDNLAWCAVLTARA